MFFDFLSAVSVSRQMQHRFEYAEVRTQISRNRDVFKHAHFAEQPDILKRTRKSEFGDLMRLQFYDIGIAPKDAASGRFIHAGDHIERGRFACSVRPYQADDFAVIDFEIQIPNRRESAELYRRVNALQHQRPPVFRFFNFGTSPIFAR